MCFGVNVGLDTRCVLRNFQVCRLSTKKVKIRKIVRKEKSLKPGRVNYPVPVHHASTHPLGTKKLPVLNLEMLETSMMA